MQEKTRSLFSSLDVSTILIKHSNQEVYFPYFTGLPLEGFEANLLILSKGKKLQLITSDLDHGTVKHRKDFSIHNVKTKKQFDEFVKHNLPGEQVGLDFNALSVNEFARMKKWFPGKKLVDVSQSLQELRRTKTKKELQKIARACKITEQALSKVPDLYRKGMTEQDLALELECEMRAHGADSNLAYPSIVASQGNAGIPHHVTSSKKISKGWLLLDVGCRYQNYCSDLSRTFYLGKAGERERAQYQLVYHAKESAEKILKAGAKAKDLYFQAETVLQSKGWNMIHSLGHGVGLEVHDVPDRMGPDTLWSLEKDMVVTVEPGIYWNKGGIRLEDTYVVTAKGFQKFCKPAPKQLIEI